LELYSRAKGKSFLLPFLIEGLTLAQAMPIPTANFKSAAAVSRFFLVCLIGLGLDLWSKNYAFAHLSDAGAISSDTRPSVVKFIPGWVHFEITTNRGAVFGLGQGQKWLFLGVSVVAIVFLSYLFATSKRQRFYQVILGMLLAGVLGNMYDRIAFGYVRDMIHALPGWKWPGAWQVPLINYPGGGRDVFPFIFNVADILLCVGVGLMIIYSLFAGAEQSEKKVEPAPGAAPQA
jgi:signal peptidase II